MSFQIALSALRSINGELDNISNNIANGSTIGYKSSRTNFASIYTGTAPGGVQIASLSKTLDKAGGLLDTGKGLNAAISGKGFFIVKDGQGTTNYTRAGIFEKNVNGFLVDHLGRKVQGYKIEGDSGTLGELGDIEIPTGQIPAQATNKLEYQGNMSADWKVPTKPFNPDFANGETPDSASYNDAKVSVVYDSLGRSHTITQYFVKTASSSIEINYVVDGKTLAGKTKLTFDENGKLTGGDDFDLSFSPDEAAPMQVKISYDGSTQFGGESSESKNLANGFASGSFVDASLDENGFVVARFSNGQNQKIARLALASFANENGLSNAEGTSWQETSSSGSPLIGTANSGQFSALAVSQVEQSNVDIASELVGLMSSQRNYQANTKVISTQSEIMQTLMQAL